MNSRRIIWGILCLVVIVLFYFWIPVHVYQGAPFLLSIVAALAFFICGFQVVADYESLYEVFHRRIPAVAEPSYRRLAPFMVIPSVIFLFSLYIHQIHTKEKVLKEKGKLTKGYVLDGQSTSTTRRMRTSTTYSITVQYTDTLERKYTVEESVDGSEFNELYKGAMVDVVYWPEHPEMAKVVVRASELSTYADIPEGNIEVNHLIKILDGKTRADTILALLNSINYEWTQGSSNKEYNNLKLNMAIRIHQNDGYVAYIQKAEAWNKAIAKANGVEVPAFSFEDDLIKKGFKKKEASRGDNTFVLFYNDSYLVNKETKTIKKEVSEGQFPSWETYDIYYVSKNQ